MNLMKPASRNPLTWVPSLYFAMGLPFVVLNMVCVLMFKGLDVSDAQITFWTSLIMWPWTIKFLWSPFLEMFRTKKFFVVATQLASGLLFGLVALALGMPHFFAVCIALLALVAVSGATHDIAADGVYMSELTAREQSKYIGLQGAFYNLAKLVATGGLVYCAGMLIDRHAAAATGMSLEAAHEAVKAGTLDETVRHAAAGHGWMVIMLVCAAVMLLAGFYHLRTLPSGGGTATGVRSSREAFRSLGAMIRNFFTKRHIWYYIAFIILYRLGEGFVMKIVPLFLKSSVADGGLGLSDQEIGLYYGSFGAAAFVVGSLLAGWYIARRGLRRTLFTLCCIFNLPFLVYTYFAIAQPSDPWLIGSGIVFEYFGYGFGFVGLTLFMMQQVAPGPHQMAHYAFASGIMNLSVMVTGAASGFLSGKLGYELFFIVVMFATIPAFLMTWFMPFTYPDGNNAAEK